jgi:hypothetical protein
MKTSGTQTPWGDFSLCSMDIILLELLRANSLRTRSEHSSQSAHTLHYVRTHPGTIAERNLISAKLARLCGDSTPHWVQTEKAQIPSWKVQLWSDPFLTWILPNPMVCNIHKTKWISMRQLPGNIYLVVIWLYVHPGIILIYLKMHLKDLITPNIYAPHWDGGGMHSICFFRASVRSLAGDISLTVKDIPFILLGDNAYIRGLSFLHISRKFNIWIWRPSWEFGFRTENGHHITQRLCLLKFDLKSCLHIYTSQIN